MIPWLTVVMPIHKGERYLARTLESVRRAQARGIAFRLYDSSPDPAPTRAIAKAFENDLDLTWQACPDIVPWTAKTNLGVREAQSAHIAMLHQDDIWLGDHAHAARDAATRWPEASMSIAPSRFIDHADRTVGTWHLPLAHGLHDTNAALGALIVQNVIAIPSPVILREAWLSSGGMDEALWYTADWDLYLKLARLGPIAVRPQTTTAFRLHGGSLTMAGRHDANVFRDQHERVLTRHSARAREACEATDKARALRMARASLDMNCALAALSAGMSAAGWQSLGKALLSLARLGPTQALRYVRASRLADRVVARLRIALGGGYA